MDIYSSVAGSTTDIERRDAGSYRAELAPPCQCQTQIGQSCGKGSNLKWGSRRGDHETVVGVDRVMCRPYLKLIVCSLEHNAWLMPQI